MGLQARTELLSALALVVQPTTSLACGGLASSGTASVGGASHPTELLVVDDRRVGRVDEDDLVELVTPILTDPVGVQDLEVRVATADALLRDPLDALRHRDLRDPRLGGLSLHVDLALPQSTSSDSGSTDDDALLGLVSALSSGVESSRAIDAEHDRVPSPARHPVTAEVMGQCVLRTLPGFSNVMIETSTHMHPPSTPATLPPFMSLPTRGSDAPDRRNGYGTPLPACHMDVTLIPVGDLRAHEEIKPNHLRRMIDKLRTQGHYHKPILVDRDSGCILDGHHRWTAAKALELSRVPAIELDYLEDDRIEVDVWPTAALETISKEDVLSMAASEEVFPAKTSRHTVRFEIPRIEVGFDELSSA